MLNYTQWLRVVFLLGMVNYSLLSAGQKPAISQDIIQRHWQQIIANGTASVDKNNLSVWTVAESTPPGKGFLIEPGPMIYASTYHTAPPFIYDPQLRGPYRIHIGFYLPENITYTGVAAKLDNEIAYTCVADPRASLPDRGQGYDSFLDADFIEVEFITADLTDRKIIIYHPQGCRSFITHFRFVPFSEDKIAAERANGNKRPFDSHIWLDYMDQIDQVDRLENDWWHNSPQALHRYVRYFCDYNANCLGYRFLGGGRGRYNSNVLNAERERYIDKRLAPDIRDPWACYRFGNIQIDVLREWVKWTHFYGKKAFAVWCFEQGHGHPTFLASFNVEYPQFQGRHKDGTFNLSWASLAHPEVVDHYLAIAQEVLDRGVDGFVFDFQRISGWYQQRDITFHHFGLGGWQKAYDPPAIETYLKKYGVDPRSEPDNNRRWIEFCAGYHTNFFRQLKKLCRTHQAKTGRAVEIVLALPAVSKDPYTTVKVLGVDWEKYVEEGLITSMSPIISATGVDGKMHTLDDLVEIMEYVHEKCRNKCDVIWPIAHYYGTFNTIASNMHLKRPDDLPALIDRILKLAHEHGAAGVQLTTVDYNMVGREKRPRGQWVLGPMTIDMVMRYHYGLNGPYRWQKTSESNNLDSFEK